VNTLLELNSSKVLGPNSVPPLILKKRAFEFALPLCMLFNMSWATFSRVLGAIIHQITVAL
jgi:hypothetical protein